MHDTSPGREALIEAMRVEQARIYGQTLPEQEAAATPEGAWARRLVTDLNREALHAQIRQMSHEGASTAAIALRLGTAKQTVRRVLKAAS